MAKKNKSSASVPKGQEPTMQPTTTPSDVLNTSPLDPTTTTEATATQAPATEVAPKQNKIVMAPIKLKTHIIFEGEPKAPGDVVKIQAKDLKDWVGAGLADAVEPE